MASREECVIENYFSVETYVVGTQKNHPNEHPQHMFELMDKKIFTIYAKKLFLNQNMFSELKRIISVST